MKRLSQAFFFLAAVCFVAGLLQAQSPQGAPASSVVSKSVNAIGYQVGGGETKVDLKATELMPQARGEAKVEAKKGVATIDAEMKGLAQPTKLGSEFLTYVMWVVSPDGRTSNVGEILTSNSGEGKLKATTQLQTFSLVVTAEPYFSVRQPSEMVILINEIRKDTKGKVFLVSDYKLLKRGQYEKLGNPLALSLDLKKVPLDMYEARNAVEIAKSRGADKYAPEIFGKAENSLKMAENLLARKANSKEIVSTARQAVQFSEDARALAIQRQDEERIESERQAAAAKAKAEAEAKAAVEAEAAKRKADEEAKQQAELAAARQAQIQAEAAGAKRRADEEARHQAELAAARQAQIQAEAAEAKRKADEDARRQAELASAREAQMKAEADAAALRAKLEADSLKAKEEAANAEAERARQAAEQARQAAEALRAQLLEQLNRILDTRDTPRGLVVNMADVLFDTGKYDLKPTTREKLARLSGVMLAHSGLNLAVEGHTDSTGSDELNQRLSEQRAGTVREYLIEQGLLAANVTAKGFGKSMPVADNGTTAGRQQNRRVEIIVSGEVIGAKIGN
jgi:outer membrane protein OmpA-like peptidoglycan-associated protein